MPRSRPKRDYASRGAYIDHLNRWVWTVDSHGHKSEMRVVQGDEDAEIVAQEEEAKLDISDPIRPDDFVPPPLSARSYLRLI